MENDAALLREFAERGQSGSLRTLIDRHVNQVYSAALRRVGGDVQLAEDVVQQVFVAMTRQARRLGDHPCLGAWLHRATCYHAANLVRSERRRKERDYVAMNITNEREVDWRAAGPVLDEAIDDLRESDRRAVILRFFNNCTYVEIGEALTLSEDGARRRVERALDRLRVSLERRHIKSSAAALAAALSTNAVTAAPPGLAGEVGSLTTAITPAALGPVHALLAFMSTTKTSIGVGSVIVVLTASFVARPAWEDARAAERAQATLISALARSRDEQDRLNERLRRSEDELGRLDRLVAERARSVVEQSLQETPEQKGAALLAQYPYLRDAFDALLDARFEYEWGPFLRERAATPEQRAAFFQMMRDEATLAVQDADRGTWWMRLMSPSGQQPSGSRLREIFGEEGLRDLRAYRHGDAARKAVAQAAGVLSFLDAPLRADQVDELIRLLSARGDAGGKLAGLDPARLKERTRAFLTAEQQDWVVAAFTRGRTLDEINRLRERGTSRSNGGQP